MTYVETNDSRVLREIESKALLAANPSEVQRSRAARAFSKRSIASQESIATRLDNVESSLTSLSETLNTLMELIKGNK